MIDKNEKKERAKRNRVLVSMNTGTRIMADSKTYNRRKFRDAMRKEMEQRT